MIFFFWGEVIFCKISIRGRDCVGGARGRWGAGALAQGGAGVARGGGVFFSVKNLDGGAIA